MKPQVEFGIIFVTPPLRSTQIMFEDLETCIEPYLPAFEQTFATDNYAAQTIVTYRRRARQFGALLDQAGITPSSVTPDCVDPLTRSVPRARKNTIRLDIAQHSAPNGSQSR